MSAWFYLILDFLTIVFPLAATWDRRINFRSWWPGLWAGIGVANLIYLPWDIWFTKAGVWGFNPDFHLPGTFLSLPLEEWLWFIVTPYACLFIMASIFYFFPKVQPINIKYGHGMLALLFVVVSLFNPDNTYTFVVFGVAGLITLISQFRSQLNWSYFWLMYAVTLIPFFIFNGALTGLFTENPVVWYNNSENLGIRMTTIPLEDSVYLLAYLMIIFLFVGKKVQRKTK